MARAMAKVAIRSHTIQTTVTWEAGLELELELNQGRDLVQHNLYSPVFILLGIKGLGTSPHHPRLLLVWANLCPDSSLFRSFPPAYFHPSSPQTWPFLSPVSFSPFPLPHLGPSA
jgi:hypothetical protein